MRKVIIFIILMMFSCGEGIASPARLDLEMPAIHNTGEILVQVKGELAAVHVYNKELKKVLLLHFTIIKNLKLVWEKYPYKDKKHRKIFNLDKKVTIPKGALFLMLQQRHPCISDEGIFSKNVLCYHTFYIIVHPSFNGYIAINRTVVELKKEEEK